jgi:hypothetical protein
MRRRTKAQWSYGGLIREIVCCNNHRVMRYIVPVTHMAVILAVDSPLPLLCVHSLGKAQKECPNRQAMKPHHYGTRMMGLEHEHPCPGEDPAITASASEPVLRANLICQDSWYKAIIIHLRRVGDR